jgi:nucleoside-diphosphate-sugar epimerase
MTSGPTVAMAAAVRGEPFEISYSGRAQYDFAPDVARAFLTAAVAAPSLGEARVYNVPGERASVEDVIDTIRSIVPDAEITCAGAPLPFPPELVAVGFDRDIGVFPRTPLADGVAETIRHFRRAADSGSEADNV